MADINLRVACGTKVQLRTPTILEDGAEIVMRSGLVNIGQQPKRHPRHALQLSGESWSKPGGTWIARKLRVDVPL